MEYIGIINLSSNLCWDKSVLGKKYKIILNKKEYFLYFPEKPLNWEIDKEDVYLIPPSTIKNVNFDKSINFGYIKKHLPGLYSTINYIVIECNNSKKKELYELLDIIDEWIKQFIKLLKIITDSILFSTEFNHLGNLIDLYKIDNNVSSIISNTKNVNIIISIPNYQKSVKNMHVETAINLLNSKFVLSESYEYYIDAVTEYENKNFRHAIIDCSTAAEICVTNRIIKDCEDKKIELPTKYLDKFNGLNKLKELLILLDDKVDINYSYITNPRNKVIHNGSIIDVADTYNCIKETKKLLDKYEKFY